MIFTYRDVINANLVCCICRNPFIEPTRTTCGHTFCLECITEALTHTPQCPVDRSSLGCDELQPADAIIRNLVDELLVECPNRTLGCLETPQRHTVEAHVRDTCQYAAIPCPSAKCKSRPLRKDLIAHEASCDRRSIECEACGEVISVSEAEAHANLCPQASISCSDCSSSIARSSLASHAQICPLKTIPCTHATFGCPWVGVREDLASSHLHTCAYEALKGFFAIHQRQMSELRMENTVLREEILSLRNSSRAMATDLEKAKAALGPWYRPASSSSQSTAPTTAQSLNTQSTLSATQNAERLSGRRRLSSPFTTGMLGFLDTQPESTENSHSNFPVPTSPPSNFTLASPPLPASDLGMGANSPLPSVLLQDFNSQLPRSIAPIDTSRGLHGALDGLRNSVVGLSTELESLSRRQNMHFTTEMLRMHEEVASLRATVHGLRMQVHTFLTSQVLHSGSGIGGVGYTQFGSGDSATVQYVNQSPPPSTVISIANTVTHRRVENKL